MHEIFAKMLALVTYLDIVMHFVSESCHSESSLKD
jgi:hypothetical protein